MGLGILPFLSCDILDPGRGTPNSRAGATAMVRIASYNVENLFAGAKALNGDTWGEGQPILKAHHDVNELFELDVYTAAVKRKIRDLLLQLDIYAKNEAGAIRRKQTPAPKWAWMRKNRGSFDREPADKTEDVEIIAAGRDDWIGWVELAKETVDEVAVQMTARVIHDVNADIIGIVEAEDRPALVRFNRDLLDTQYGHIMLVDGNDDRGIDVGIMTKKGFDIESIRSNVDATDSSGVIFSRDCPQYEIVTPGGTTIHVLVNHFKSQSGGGGEKRKRQAKEVRKIVDSLVDEGENVVVLGDLNEGPAAEGQTPVNLRRLFLEGSPLVPCYSLPDFEVGEKPGSFDSCGIRNRIDFILISESLRDSYTGGGMFRKGLWGGRLTRPTAWETYAEMTDSSQQASDHAAVFVDLDI
jgi:endonuclease/exonuclease/phosphatase family metal-dependent hydrolase